MSFDGPNIQTPNQERRKIQKPPVIMLIILAIILIAVMAYQVWIN